MNVLCLPYIFLYTSLQLLLLNVTDWMERHLFSCPFKKYLHIECPGCGMQRSIIFLLKGNIASSINIYPAILPIVVLIVILLLHLKFHFKNGAKTLKYLHICTVIIIVLFYIFKLITHKTFLWT
jgi:hypothetical protein